MKHAMVSFFTGCLFLLACTSTASAPGEAQATTAQAAGEVGEPVAPESSAPSDPVEAASAKADQAVVEYGTIERGRVGDFELRSDITQVDIPSSWSLEKSTKTYMAEGDEYTEFVYTLKEGEETLLVANGLTENDINQITVVSDEFKTDKDVSVGSSLQDFVAAYPEYSIWYSYVSPDGIVADTEELPGVQFILSKEDYTGSRAKLDCGSDICPLQLGDFKDSTSIQSIRLFPR